MGAEAEFLDAAAQGHGWKVLVEDNDITLLGLAEFASGGVWIRVAYKKQVLRWIGQDVAGKNIGKGVFRHHAA